ncbi:hypothetical protein ATE84_2935 [Aquimarina sp. MAR_2010_214]|uniref:hypothetical protein n=1 Tax=Aquimarina sp. MAR_2010_214 TaxID=1250026 RepID=UPI000C70BE8F|nr:hypothetical protein [Aquimarina sp. MAR_2010_214]PKV50867.1 hypothetical protein ATE84_2935 [Aquimarina sp. MAR_2010_214]
MLLLKGSASRHLLVLCIAIFTFSTIHSQKAVRVGKYIEVKVKNKKQFEVFNSSGTRLGIVFSHKPSKIIYLNPAKSKSFSFKNYPITSRISLHYTKQEWKKVSGQLEAKYNKMKFLYSFIGQGDDVFHNLGKVGAGRGSEKKEERKKRDQKYKTVKNAQKAEFKRHERKLIERLQYYGYLYHASNGYDGRYFSPLKLTETLGSYY